MPDKALLESLAQDNKTRIAISEEELKGTNIPIADVKAKEKVSALRKGVTGIFYGVTLRVLLLPLHLMSWASFSWS